MTAMSTCSGTVADEQKLASLCGSESQYEAVGFGTGVKFMAGGMFLRILKL